MVTIYFVNFAFEMATNLFLLVALVSIEFKFICIRLQNPYDYVQKVLVLAYNSHTHTHTHTHPHTHPTHPNPPHTHPTSHTHTKSC